MSSGYIYLRSNEMCKKHNSIKLGKTTNIPDREKQYITYELKRGIFEMVIEVSIFILDKLEIQLQDYFNSLNLHVIFDGGIEYYKNDIIKYIIPFLDKNKIKYKILSIDEINKLIGKKRIIINKILTPSFYQQEIIDKSVDYLKENDKGLLVIPCGVGKTLISLWISQKLCSTSILIGVPNILLLEQWYSECIKVFAKFNYLIIKAGISENDILSFLRIYSTNFIVITTFASAFKVHNICKSYNFIFDIKILDETHHLTSSNINKSLTTKAYVHMLPIKSHKQIALTATLKVMNLEETDVVTNDNIDYFGKIIDKKTLLWAISNNIVCDYEIQAIISNELPNGLPIKVDNHQLFLSAFTALKSIKNNHVHHILIYSNSTFNSNKIKDYIEFLLYHKYFDINDLFYSNYHGEMNVDERNLILKNYTKSTFGIITCVYCLGEGFNCPLINGTLFGENMSSNIRIVQSALRCCRKNTDEPNKKAKIIIPIYNKSLVDDESNDYRKVTEIIKQMSEEDETISQKIKAFVISIEKNSPKNPSNSDKTQIDIYDEELTKKIRLITLHRECFNITYEKAKNIIASKNILNKKDYYELCDKDCRLSKNPEDIFKNSFTNWIDYLSIKRIYYDLQTCKDKIEEYLLQIDIRNIDIDFSFIANELYKNDINFPSPELWCEYYDINDMSEIIKINDSHELVDF